MATSLKRHEGLKPLARDHAVGLVCAQKLQRAVRAATEERMRLSQELKSVCNHILLPYLDDEKSILSAVVPQRYKQRFEEHHAHIHRMAEALNACDINEDPGIGLLARIGDALDDHVRWEQHTLFPAIEQSLTNEQLSRLANATSKLDIRRKRPTQSLHSSINQSDRIGR